MQINITGHNVEVTEALRNYVDLFAEAGSETMYAAVDALVDKLERQLVKHKEKLTK